MGDLVIKAPLPGWAQPLDEVEDEVFATRMLGDGLAIDPTEGVLRAPCDGVVTALPESAHAVTLRAANGAEILLHVGIDTVALKGAGFRAEVRTGQRVRAGDTLIRFDLDRISQGARSLVTPVLVTDPERFRVIARHAPGVVRAGDTLMTLRAGDAAAVAPAGRAAAACEASCTLRIDLPHGLHARPAALLAHGLKQLDSEVTLGLRGRVANAKSAVALLALGARRGDVLELRASGSDAALVQGAIERALARAAVESRGAAKLPDAEPPGHAPASASGPIVASPGMAVGPAVHIARRAPVVTERGDGVDFERQRLDETRARLAARMRALASQDRSGEPGIIRAHLEFLEDPELLAAAHRGIAHGQSAGYAWRSAVNAAVQSLDAVDNAHLAARADDLRDLELQVLEILAGKGDSAAVALPPGAIVLARDLLPSQFLALDATRIGGICTVSRAATSHVAILAGARGIPMLAGVDTALLKVADGTTLVLDADRSRITVAPDAAVLAEAQGRIAERARLRASLLADAAADCHTADGVRIEVLANIGSVAEAAAAAASGAEGCGLLRTEFMFLDRSEPPGQAEQLDQYQEIARQFPGKPVVVRTLDAGGDKPIPFLAMPAEENPALGLRGIRASLLRPELLRAQVAAILSVRPGDRCRILLPMVNEPAEIEAVRAIIRDLAPRVHGRADIPVGIMIETPAAAVSAARLAAHADFFSIGTNDLSQYALAIDRTHPVLAGKLDALDPGVLGLIGMVCTAAGAARRPVAVCGGLASDPSAAPLLVGLGVVELSAVPGAIPEVKAAVRRHTLAACRAIAGRALAAPDAASVRAIIGSAMAGTQP